MKNTDHARRRILKAMGIGGTVGAAGLPGSWSQPAVETVVLPAHGNTSVVGTFSDENIAVIPQNSNSIIDLLIPSAVAWSWSAANVCMDVDGSSADVYVVFEPGSGNHIRGKLGVSFPFDYVVLDYQGGECSGSSDSPPKYSLNGQLQEVDGEMCVVGNIREDARTNCSDPERYYYYPYVSKPAPGSCNLTIDPPV